MGKKYVDERGWRYQVISGIGTEAYKARYQKPGSASWRCVAALPWRLTEEAAQADLDQMAKKKGWSSLEGSDE